MFKEVHLLISFILPTFRAVWRQRVALFWPTWITTTIASATFVAWAVSRATRPTNLEAAHERIILSQQLRSRAAVAALAMLALFLGLYIMVSLTWEDFAHYDHSAFTLFTLRGHPFAPPIWRDNGRFFPLGHQEFNLIRHFTHTIVGYHVFPIVQLLLLSCILLVLDNELRITERAALTAALFLAPAIVISYTGLFYPERNSVFWLACLILFVTHFERTYSTTSAVAAAVCAQIMIYYKETAFVLVVGFALGRLILHCRNRNPGESAYQRLWDKEGCLDLCLASLGGLFLVHYLALMFPHPNMQYAGRGRLPWTELFSDYIKMDLLAWVFLSFVLVRTYLILRRRVVPSPLWDGLAVGGLACLMAYFCLGMFSAYYLAPVDLIAVLYVGRFTILSWERSHLWSKVAVTFVLCLVLIQNVSLSAFRLFEEKNGVHAKAEIASLVDARYRTATTKPLRLFFPFAIPFALMEFASYLDYRGIPVEGGPEEAAGRNGVVLVSRSVTLDGPCVPYRSIICHPGGNPAAGDLVVILPDDDASLVEVSSYLHQGELLFSYEPRPRVPKWLHPFVERLHIASVPFRRKELPDHWLNASVTAWR